MSDVDDDDRFWRRKGQTGDLAPKLAPIRTGFYGARILGGLAEVTVGCMVWAHAHGDPHQVRLDPRGEPRGGIVLNTFAALDQDWLEETGEPVERRHYRCFNPYTPPNRFDQAITVLTEVQIVPDGCEAPSPGAITRALRSIDRWLADQHGPIDLRQAQLQTDAGRLAAVLLGAAA